MGVATATNRDATIERLTRCGLIDYFDYILCGDQVTKRKPHPETYLKVLDYFNINPKDTLVLEDSLVGGYKKIEDKFGGIYYVSSEI